jgi:hypothetical protein
VTNDPPAKVRLAAAQTAEPLGWYVVVRQDGKWRTTNEDEEVHPSPEAAHQEASQWRELGFETCVVALVPIATEGDR